MVSSQTGRSPLLRKPVPKCRPRTNRHSMRANTHDSIAIAGTRTGFARLREEINASNRPFGAGLACTKTSHALNLEFQAGQDFVKTTKVRIALQVVHQNSSELPSHFNCSPIRMPCMGTEN